METVPEGVAFRPYAVTAVADGEESNVVGFEIRSGTLRLDTLPSSANLLLPLGTRKELLAVAGGTLPYKLLPLNEDDQMWTSR